MPKRTQAAALFAALALSLAAAPALAKEPTAAEIKMSKDMVRDAITEAKAGRCPEAIRMLKESIALRESAEAYYHLADCQATTGKLKDALGSLKRGQAVADQQKDRAMRATISEGLKVLEAGIPMISLELPAGVEGVAVTIDGAAVPEAELKGPIPVDPGEHTVEVKAPGRKTFTRTVKAEQEARIVVSVELKEGPKEEEVAGGKRTVPLGTWIAAGASVALLAGGVGAFVAAGSEADAGREACAKSPTCDEGQRSTVRSLDGAALGLWIGAGLAAGAAVTLFVLQPKKPADGAAKQGASARVVVGPGSMSIVGAF
ncbi:tetratricopeptide repeat protein [Polyangium aurulentum]|uniref:tetratricopeptide repeat protein n=1 Tax=Polyangium aurulentum TaxID=2567896 RepID=UPI0010ADC9D7|nr:tetratricopeptide repeat protein [Polyangium aurulentum]UQA58792.1 hypothetical protein E8A73_047475 [Polyangium aurulentum]